MLSVWNRDIFKPCQTSDSMRPLIFSEVGSASVASSASICHADQSAYAGNGCRIHALLHLKRHLEL